MTSCAYDTAAYQQRYESKTEMQNDDKATPVQREVLATPVLSNSDQARLRKELGQHAFAKSLLTKHCARGLSWLSNNQIRAATEHASITMPFFNQLAELGQRPGDPLHQAAREWALGEKGGEATLAFEDQAATAATPLSPEQYGEALEHYVGGWAYTIYCLALEIDDGLELHPSDILRAGLDHRAISWYKYLHLSRLSLSAQMEQLAEDWEVLNNSGRCPSYFAWSPGQPKWIVV